jgi:hypothetical protein
MWEDILKLDLEDNLVTMEILTITILEHHKLITLMEPKLLPLMEESEMEEAEIILTLVYSSEIFN